MLEKLKISKQKWIKLILVIIAISGIFILITKNNTVKAATYSSNIDGIDENRYPGYKAKIQELKKIYPNIQVFYTGLDWNTVITNEKVDGRNLVPKSYSSEWICEECGDKEYDTGWYCASTSAVKYIMDPRNYLDNTNIFQFQKLDKSTGTLDTSKIQLAATGSFLYDWDCVVALYNAAKDNNINAYHLLTRTIQEQGRAGTTTLSSGAKYVGTNGVTYQGLYNLFSIGASGNNAAEVKTNGLARALSEGWTSRPLSIAGGGTFIKDKYINRNQNTLYFQKFDVDSKYDGLYWHQYMQNLFGAKNEAKLMYDAYSKTNLLLNSNFEFIIPIYENMPTAVSEEPNEKYEGAINTDLKTMQIGAESDGRNYITGDILIAEWINGVANVPKNVPQMTIKSTDGTYSAGVNLIRNEGLNYSYYRIIDNLDLNKEYYLEVKLTTTYNIASDSKKTQNAKMPNMTVGSFKGTTLKVSNNKIYFSTGSYVGAINTDLKEIELKQNDAGRYYICGNMLIAEWINGVACIPKSIPNLTLKSTDGSESFNLYVGYLEGLNYYFDIFADNIDLSKQYYIEAKLTSEENISTNKTQKVLLPNKELGKYNGRTIILENNEIKFTYVGAINTDLKTIKLGTNEIGRHYIYGEILIAEWIDGKVNTPSDLPEMTIKSTDGSYSTGIHIVYNGGISYTYDRIIDNLDTSKEYYIEAKLTGKNNTGSSKTQKVKFANQEIGKYDQVRLIAEDNKLKMTDGSLYEGTINTDVKTMYVAKNEAGREYIHGNILIAEWINGAAYTPNGLPEMTLKSTDGTYSAGMHLVHEGGLNYYYDRVIFNLDTSKEYYIEVKLTSNKNIGKNKQQNANINVAKNIGMFKEKNMMIENNKIVFKGNEYEGVVNTDLKTMYIAQNEVGREYIHGNILIAEWINGVACIPNKLPEMTLKSTDGTYSAGMHLVHESGLNYYYDRVIFNLDTSKEYYIEVKLTNSNNISNKKSQQANLNAKANVGIFKETSEILLVNNKITFKNKEKAMLMTIETPEEVVVKENEEIKEIVEDKEKNEQIKQDKNEEIKQEGTGDKEENQNTTIKDENTIQENTTVNQINVDNKVN